MAYRALIRVCFSDIDYAGIVYYPRFLHYFHVALEEFFGAELGVDYSALAIKDRIGFPTVHLEADFEKPLNYGDQIEVEVRVLKIGHTSITWGYRVYKMDNPAQPVVQGHNVTVTINLDTYQKVEIPKWLKEKLRDYINRSRDSLGT